MPKSTSGSVVDTRLSPHARWQSLPAGAVRLQGGFWADRLEVNRAVSLVHGYRMLEEHGNFNNLRLAAGRGEGKFRGPVFMDSDVYKWAEAASLELGNRGDATLAENLDAVVSLISAAQMPDGYLNSYFQVVEPGGRWQNLKEQHELYCAGHLLQAAIAHRRSTGDDRLLRVAIRFADHIDARFGPGKISGLCGHPEIEMALVELYRLTRTQRYLELARYFLDERGKKRFAHGWPFDATYYQDHVPVREATAMAGHAVRQLYLLSGMTDVYLETGERALLDAALRLHRDLVTAKLFITGGAGSRHEGESFGAAYELPNDRCYCETCAAIALMQWAWRMLLATGTPAFADLVERALYNNVLTGVSLDGTRYFYVNPLLSRGGIVRPEWHGCACCPPNVMRTFSSLAHLFASEDESGVQIHQFAPMEVAVHDGRLRLQVDTRYPWDGRIEIVVTAADGDERAISLRVPQWATGAELSVNGEAPTPAQAEAWAGAKRRWAVGERLTLRLPLVPRLTAAHPRSDATRGSVALERGPLVYCFEQSDQPTGTDVLGAAIDPGALLQEQWEPGLLGGAVAIDAEGYAILDQGWDGRLYRTFERAPMRGERRNLRAIPYYAWANRGPDAMRVWIPLVPAH